MSIILNARIVTLTHHYYYYCTSQSPSLLLIEYCTKLYSSCPSSFAFRYLNLAPVVALVSVNLSRIQIDRL